MFVLEIGKQYLIGLGNITVQKTNNKLGTSLGPGPSTDFSLEGNLIAKELQMMASGIVCNLVERAACSLLLPTIHIGSIFLGHQGQAS